MATQAIETQGTRLGIQAGTESASVSFAATTNKIERSSGDFTTTFSPGMILFTSNSNNPGPFTIESVAALEIVVKEDLSTEASATTTLIGYTEVGEVTDFSGPGGSANVIDATHLRSVAREKLMGIPDEGQFTFSLNFVPGNDGQIAFRAARRSRAKQSFALVFSDDATYALFEGYALEFSVSGAVDDKVNGSATIEITGAVEWSDE